MKTLLELVDNYTRPVNPLFKQQTAFENIVGKEEVACNKQCFLFAQRFLLNQKIVSPFVNIFNIISLFAAELQEPEIGM